MLTLVKAVYPNLVSLTLLLTETLASSVKLLIIVAFTWLSRVFTSFYPMEIEGKKWRAISWTTAASLVAVVEMVASITLPQKGFLKQEEIPFDKFLKTPTGALFL